MGESIFAETHNCVSRKTSRFQSASAAVNCKRKTQLCVSTFKNYRF